MGSQKTNIEEGGLPKKERLGQFADLGGGEGGLACVRGSYTNIDMGVRNS